MGLEVTNTGDGHALDGTFLLYDMKATTDALRNHDWASAALIGVADGFDLAATVSDPFGSLIAVGLGWVMDHLEPLKGWLDDLTGDAGSVEAFSAQWEAVAASLSSSGEDLGARVRADLAHMEGEAIEGYRAYVERLSSMVESVAEGSEGVATSLRYAATMVEAVHGIVRDSIAQICGSILSYAGEFIFTGGLATGAIIEQVETRVASISARIGSTVRELISSCRELERLVDDLDWAVGKVREGLEHLHPDAARGRHEAPWLREHHAPTGGGGRHSGPIKSLPDRLHDVWQTEVPTDVVTEGSAAGSNAVASEEPERGRQDRPGERVTASER